MGYIGTAFGIVLSPHIEFHTFMRLMAKSLTITRRGFDDAVETRTYTDPDSIERAMREWGDLSTTTWSFEPYNDVESISNTFNNSEEDGDDFDSLLLNGDYSVDGIPLGVPTSCAMALHVAFIADEYGDNDSSKTVDPASLATLLQLYNKLKEQGRLGNDAYLGLTSNCCS
jgi:hypothetical protein